MNKPKVYFSKSNESDPFNIALIRHVLINQCDVELVEFKGGGPYLKKELLDCDLLLVLGPNLHKEGESFEIGRGQYDQITEFLNHKDPYREQSPGSFVLVVQSIMHCSSLSAEKKDATYDDYVIFLSELNKVNGPLSKDWKSGYAQLSFPDPRSWKFLEDYKALRYIKSSKLIVNYLSEEVKSVTRSLQVDHNSCSINASVDDGSEKQLCKVAPILAVSTTYLP